MQPFADWVGPPWASGSSREDPFKGYQLASGFWLPWLEAPAASFGHPCPRTGALRAHLAAEILAKTGQSYPQKSCGAVSLKSAYLLNTQIRNPQSCCVGRVTGELGSPLTNRIHSFVQDESIFKSIISSQMRILIHSMAQGQDRSPKLMGKNGKGRDGEAYGMEWEKMGKGWTGMGWDGTVRDWTGATETERLGSLDGLI